MKSTMKAKDLMRDNVGCCNAKQAGSHKQLTSNPPRVPSQVVPNIYPSSLHKNETMHINGTNI